MNYRVDYKVTTTHGSGENWMSFEADNDVEALYKADKILADMAKENTENGFDVTLEKISVSRIEQVEEQPRLCYYLSDYQHTGRITEQWLSPEDKEYYCNEGGIAVTICTAREVVKATPEEMDMYRQNAFEKLSALEREKRLSKKHDKTQERDC